jgi:hypothetical protein
MSYPIQDIEYGTYQWLRREVGGALDGNFNAAEWDHDKSQKVDSIIQSGYMQMLYPPPLAAPREGAPAPAPHQWSFLTPVAEIKLTGGESQYLLPDDFSGVVGDFTVKA